MVAEGDVLNPTNGFITSFGHTCRRSTHSQGTQCIHETKSELSTETPRLLRYFLAPPKTKWCDAAPSSKEYQGRNAYNTSSIVKQAINRTTNYIEERYTDHANCRQARWKYSSSTTTCSSIGKSATQYHEKKPWQGSARLLTRRLLIRMGNAGFHLLA